jgi:hypothetical protein
VTGPPAGETGLLVTRTVDTGPGGENDPNRMLAKIVASPTASEPRSKLRSSNSDPLPLHDSMARKRGSGAGAAIVFLREAGRSQ